MFHDEPPAFPQMNMIFFPSELHLHFTGTITGCLTSECVLSTPCLSGEGEATLPPWFQAFKNPCSSRCLASTHHHSHGGRGIAATRTCDVGLRRTGNGIINKIKQRLCVQRWCDSIIPLDKKDGQRTVTCDNFLGITSATSVGPTLVLPRAWHWYDLWAELQERLLHT